MYSFRIATEHDIEVIVALVESAYRGNASRAGWTTEADLLDGQRTDAEEVSRLIKADDSCILLCQQDSKIVASVHLLNKHSYGYLGMFAVTPAEQGKGIGKLLLAEAEKLICNKWHCPLLHMTVISLRKDLIAWYERRGYKSSGHFLPFPYGDERYGLPKRDDLKLIVLEKSLY
ncbi:MAG: GNAT family N-acetyltransferase [Gammaproteobacteria bacterium]|nr:GNAT family N-acetyltransferase [Gammaproteobacteria bacterium]